MMHTMRWIGSEVREPPTFYGLNDLEEFLMKFELEVVESLILPILYIEMKATPSCWWGAQKENINNSFQCKRLLHLRFGIERGSNTILKYDGKGIPA